MSKGRFEMLDVLRTFIAANVPLKLESQPGAGKTSFLGALFRASQGYLKTMVAVNHDPTDFGGIPVPDLPNGRYALLPGDWAVELAEATTTHSLVGIFLDEANTAGRAVLSACLKLVDEKRVGNFQLPFAVRVLLAVNPAEANGGVDLTPAMANRMGHVAFHIPELQWCDGITAGFPDPNPLVVPDAVELDAAVSVYRAQIAAFIRGHQSMLEQYPTDISQRSGPFPTRRTWTLSADVLGAAEVLGFNERTKQASVAALIGPGATDAFMDYIEAANSVDVSDAFTDPDAFTLPGKDDELFVTLDRIVDIALTLADPKTAPKGKVDESAMEAACAIMVRVCNEAQRPGVAMSSIKRIAAFYKTNPAALTGAARTSLRVFAPMLKDGDDW